jgi:hypothetical protein
VEMGGYTSQHMHSVHFLHWLVWCRTPRWSSELISPRPPRRYDHIIQEVDRTMQQTYHMLSKRNSNESMSAGKYSQIRFLNIWDDINGCRKVRRNTVFGQVYSSSNGRYRMTFKYPAFLTNDSISSEEISLTSRPSLLSVFWTRSVTFCRSALNFRR